jgi:hypothetical protein
MASSLVIEGTIALSSAFEGAGQVLGKRGTLVLLQHAEARFPIGSGVQKDLDDLDRVVVRDPASLVRSVEGSVDSVSQRRQPCPRSLNVRSFAD